jgi:nickel/cobalt transporter (NicO) family protein
MQKIINRWLRCGFAAAFLVLSCAPASPVAGTPPPASSAVERGVAARFWSWVLNTQSALNKDMAAAVRNMKSDNPATAALTLVAIAFAYGVLHAAGPGHGKAVISSYVLANEQTVRRGIALSFLAALFQALSAIFFVGILALVLRQTSLQMKSTEATIETISWGLVAVVGAYLLWRQVKPLLNRSSATHAAASQVDHQHHDGHNHQHGEACSCGHSHMPAPKDLQGAWSWRKALPIALSVGIRPCSGALLLMIFALSQGMLWAGILGTFAMAFGTAITVSVLAALAVSSRNWAEQMSGAGSVWAERVHTLAGVAGAGLVFLMGTAFFIASLTGGAPL